MSGRAAAIPDRRRPFLFAAIVAAHVLAIALLLRPPPAAQEARTPALALFDVAPPVEPPPPLPPPPPPSPKAAAADRPSGGGSPGVRRERAAARVEAPAPPAREAMEATLAPLAPTTMPALAAGTALADLGAGGAEGVGAGSGAGEGPGAGDGFGTDVGEVAFARALWIKRPPNATFAAYWPISSRNMRGKVIVELVCLVRRSGKPYRCRRRSERPAGLGFYRTALFAMPEALVKPVARNGDPLWDVPVIITVEFGTLDVAPRIPVSAAASAPRAR